MINQFCFVLPAGNSSSISTINWYDSHIMQSNIEIPVTLYPSRAKIVWLLLIGLLFVLAGIWMVHEGQWFGYVCAGFFGLGLPILALQLHPKAAYLRLTSEGFTFCTSFRAYTIRWTDVQKFAVNLLPLPAMTQMVAWNFSPHYPRYQASARARAISKSMSGYDGALPNTYGMKAQELAELMERLRQKYATTQNA